MSAHLNNDNLNPFLNYLKLYSEVNQTHISYSSLVLKTRVKEE